MRLLFFLYFLVQTFFCFSQSDDTVISTGDQIFVQVDSSNLWFLPSTVKIGGVVSFEQFQSDSASKAMIIYPVTRIKVECGEWHQDTLQATDWIKDDSIAVYPKDPKWVVSAETVVKTIPIVQGVKLCPCGCPPTRVLVQHRIDATSGFKQHRSTVIRYLYSPEKTGFNKLI